LCVGSVAITDNCGSADARNKKWNPVWSQRRKEDNMASNLLRIAENSEILGTSKMTIGTNALAMMTRCTDVVSTDIPRA